jgi:hypothetical protein
MEMDEILYEEIANKLLKILNGLSYHDIEESIYKLKKLIDEKSKLIID